MSCHVISLFNKNILEVLTLISVMQRGEEQFLKLEKLFGNSDEVRNSEDRTLTACC